MRSGVSVEDRGFGSSVTRASPEQWVGTGGHSVSGSVFSLLLSSWRFHPSEIKVTSSTSGTTATVQVGRRKTKSYGPPTSYSFWSKADIQLRLVQLSGLSASLRTQGPPVWFPVRAHAWVTGQVPSRGRSTSNHTWIFLSLSFPLPSPLSKINKWNIFLKYWHSQNLHPAPFDFPVVD